MTEKNNVYSGEIILEKAYGKRPQIHLENLRIAVARDEAFCFYYRDNLNMLKYYGAEPVFFSPMHDKKLPENIHGLLLGGGYPELYAEALSENVGMRDSIREALRHKLPSLAECGGFMYLHESLTDRDGRNFPMVGVIPAECHDTGKLVRFGYIELTENRAAENGMADGKACLQGSDKFFAAKEAHGFLRGEEGIRAHEFHYFDSTDNGADCTATKPVTGRSWNCIHAGEEHFWGFPHLYYPSDPKFVERFAESMLLFLQR